MGDELPESEQLQAESDRNRIEFLRTELKFCLTLASVAESERTRGDLEHAAKSLADAERAYATLDRFMSDPKHAKHITKEQRVELRAGMDRLRATLDKLGERA